MAKASLARIWARTWDRQWRALSSSSLGNANRTAARALKSATPQRRPPSVKGTWTTGIAMGPQGARRYKLYQPVGLKFGERLPLMVMLHGCGQDATSFALCTRMNRLAAHHRFLVLYPEQDRLANAQFCWNWFDTLSGQAYREVELIMKAIDQVCWLYAGNRAQVAIAGLSAGASMAALLVTRHPDRFKAITMHSGIPPGTAHSGLSALSAMHGNRATRPLPATPSDMAASWPPLLVIHGRMDHLVALENGQAAARVWSDAAGSDSNKTCTVQRGQRYAANVTDFQRSGQSVATLVEVDKLGHAWSGGAPRHAYSDALGPDASRLVWAFSKKQFQRESPRPRQRPAS